MLSFDDYGDIGARLDAVLAGERRPAHEPRDRRRLLPIAPAARSGGPGQPPARHGRPVLTQRDPGPPARAGARVRPADAAAPAVRRPGGPAQDRVWV